MQDIMIDSSELWDYCEENEDTLLTAQHMIAENPDYGMSVWITRESGSPEIIVESDDIEIYREEILNEKDAKRTADRIYEEYLSIKAIETVTEAEDDGTVYVDDEDEDNQVLINEREDDLDAAVMEFVNIVSDTGCYNIKDEVLDDLKEHFLEYMHKTWGIGIYRPMYLEDVDTGEEYFTEYPYEDMVFDDEDDPETEIDGKDKK
jgi:hypothetical protein